MFISVWLVMNIRTVVIEMHNFLILNKNELPID